MWVHPFSIFPIITCVCVLCGLLLLICIQTQPKFLHPLILGLNFDKNPQGAVVTCLEFNFSSRWRRDDGGVESWAQAIKTHFKCTGHHVFLQTLFPNWSGLSERSVVFFTLIQFWTIEVIVEEVVVISLSNCPDLKWQCVKNTQAASFTQLSLYKSNWDI